MREYFEALVKRYEETTPGQWGCYSGGGYVSVGVNNYGAEGYGPCGIVEKKLGSTYGDGRNQNAKNYEFIADSHQDIKFLINLIKRGLSGPSTEFYILLGTYLNTVDELAKDRFKNYTWLGEVYVDVVREELVIEYYRNKFIDPWVNSKGEEVDNSVHLPNKFMGLPVRKVCIGKRNENI